VIDIKIFKQRLVLRTPFRIAHGTYAYRENVFIVLRKGAFTGYGEAPGVPYYGVSADEIAADLRSVLGSRRIHGLISELISRNIGVYPRFAYPASVSAFQSAVVGLQSVMEKKTPAGILGIGINGEAGLGITQAQEVPPTSLTIAYDENIENMVQRAADSGFSRLKIKAGIPGDIERIRRIREKLPEALIRVDANQGWSLKEAPGNIAALERLGVECIEEPSAGIPKEIEQLARNTAVPIILDESVRDIDQLRRYLAEAPSISGIVVKIAKSGGPAAALSLINAARDAGLQIMLSSMVESGLGIGAALPLAPLCTWIDLDSPLLLADNLFTGLSYPDGIPTIQTGGLHPSTELGTLIESLPTLYEV
jgi:L-Ala-D/L-Glu epimerase